VKPLDADTAQRVALVHGAALSKLARQPVALDVRAVSLIADVLYVCHGDNVRAVAAIVDGIVEALRRAGESVGHVEGRQQAQWVLLDLGDVIVHVFHGDRRAYYNLEGLWHDAVPVELDAA
jgi:ribosome-associated protein